MEDLFDGKKKREGPAPIKLCCMVPPELAKRLDDAVKCGEFRNRSAGVRGGLSLMLASGDPAMERMRDQLIEYLSSPVLLEFAAVTGKIAKLVRPETADTVMGLVAVSLAGYFSSVLPGVFTEKLRKELIQVFKGSG